MVRYRILWGIICVLSTLFCVQGKMWYIDKNATGSKNGTSWTDAWIGLASIDWSLIQGGDTVLISGGTDTKTYTEKLQIMKSGSAGKPITFMPAQSAPHNGMVIIQPPADDYGCIVIRGYSYITICGRVGSDDKQKMRLTGSYYNGIYIDGDSHDITLEYLDITGNHHKAIRMQVPQCNSIADIHHCLFHDNCTIVDGNADAEIWFYKEPPTTGDGTFGCLKFHHNDMFNFHADGLKIWLYGVDFYNNTIRDRGSHLNDHPDGIQSWANYLRVYNNSFYNFERTDESDVNSYIRYNAMDQSVLEPHAGHIWIYNNIFTEENPPLASDAFRGIELVCRPNTITVEDILVANNLFKRIPFGSIIIAFNTAMTTTEVSSIALENNVFIDPVNTSLSNYFLNVTAHNSITFGSHGSEADVIIDYNSVYSTGPHYANGVAINGSMYSYSDFKKTTGCQKHEIITDPLLCPDFTVQPKSPLIDAGIALASYFTTDKKGTHRPYGSAWDIGAYENLLSIGIGSTVPNGEAQKDVDPARVLFSKHRILFTYKASGLCVIAITVFTVSGAQAAHFSFPCERGINTFSWNYDSDTKSTIVRGSYVAVFYEGKKISQKHFIVE